MNKRKQLIDMFYEALSAEDDYNGRHLVKAECRILRSTPNRHHLLLNTLLGGSFDQ